MDAAIDQLPLRGGHARRRTRRRRPGPARPRAWAASAIATPSPAQGSRMDMAPRRRQCGQGPLQRRLVGGEAAVTDEIRRQARKHECHGFLPVMDEKMRARAARMPWDGSRHTPKWCVRGQFVLRGAEGAVADQVAQRLRQRRDIEGQPMVSSGPRAKGRPVSIRHVCNSPARCRASGRAVAAGRCPAPASTAGRAGERNPWQKRQRAGVGLSGFTQRRSNSHIRQRTEQRSPIGAGDALFQVLDVADEDRDGCAPAR